MSFAGQKLGTKDSAVLAGLTLTGFSGILYATAGVIAGGATTSNMPEGTNLYYTDARADARITLQKGAVNGLCPLDATGKVAVSYLPSSVLGGMNYQGTYDASGGTYPASPAKGYYWVISVQGTLGGHLYRVNDWLTYDGTAWDFVDNSTLVTSVAGRTGAVTLAQADISGLTTASSPSFVGATLSGLTVAGFVKNNASGVLSTASAIVLTSDVSGILPIANGGTNSSAALTNFHMMWSAGGAIVEATALLNGQIFIGSTGAAPVAATLTAGANGGVVIANAAGSITLSTVQDIRSTAIPTFAGLKLTGAQWRAVTTISTATSLTSANDLVLCNGTFTATLPDAVANSGLMFDLKNIGTGTISIATVSSQTIDGAASPYTIISQWEGVTVVSNGANWVIV